MNSGVAALGRAPVTGNWELTPRPASSQTRRTPPRRVLALVVVSLVCQAVEAATSPPPPQEPADYRSPPRAYERHAAQGWTVWVEQELAERAPTLCARALDRLDRKLGELLAVLPPASHTKLRELPVYLMYGRKATAGGRTNGAEYYQRGAPRHFKHLDPRWEQCVVVYSAENYVWLSEFWSLKVLVHEFAHAWQLEQWPEEEAGHPGGLPPGHGPAPLPWGARPGREDAGRRLRRGQPVGILCRAFLRLLRGVSLSPLRPGPAPALRPGRLRTGQAEMGSPAIARRLGKPRWLSVRFWSRLKSERTA